MNAKYTIWIVVMLSVVGLDQWTKYMATRYLEHPGGYCHSKKNACTQRCEAEAARSMGSMLACKERCGFRRRRCEEKHKKVMSRWQYDLRSMRASWVCRSVSQPYSGAKPQCIVVPGFFHFRYQVNHGAAWGVFSGYASSFRRPFFLLTTVLALFLMLYFFLFRVEESNKFLLYALAFVSAGALGNLLDRFRMDYVVDFIYWFLKTKSRSYAWPTFNIADVAICVGVGMIALELVRMGSEEEDDEQAPQEKDVKPPRAHALREWFGAKTKRPTEEGVEAQPKPEDADPQAEVTKESPESAYEQGTVSKKDADQEGSSREDAADVVRDASAPLESTSGDKDEHTRPSSAAGEGDDKSPHKA